MSLRRELPVAVAVGLGVAAVAFGVARVAFEDNDPTPPRPPGTRPLAPAAATASGRALFVRMGCGSCHRLAAVGSRGQIGPDLDERLRGHTGASLTTTILDPPGGDDFGGMPRDFGERMTDRELDALVSFLLAARRDD